MFASPLPNRTLWNTATYGQLQGQDFLYKGGWWHNPSILAATGEGIEKEEPRAWAGCWNDRIVELVRLSVQDDDTLSVMLTGRGESNFTDLITRMIAAKGLDFDMVCLKPSVSPSGEVFNSTLDFKKALLCDIIATYALATEIRIYEDRPKHTKSFRDFLEDVNRNLAAIRAPLRTEVIQVTEAESTMNPVTEAAEIQKMINVHNSAIISGEAPTRSRPYRLNKTVFFTGYLITPPSAIDSLKQLVQLPPNVPEHEVKKLANNILISPRPVSKAIMDKVGGIGTRVRWRVTGLGNSGNRVWAARVAPVTPGVNIHTENNTPCVVLATRRDAKPVEASRIYSWTPVSDDQSLEFETVVGEKVLLKIEEETAQANGEGVEVGKSRKHPRDEDFPLLGSGPNTKAKPQGRSFGGNNNASWANKAGGGGGIGFAAQRGSGNNAGSGRGGGRGRGGGNFRGGGGRGGSNRTGGRGGGRGGYKSLDDSAARAAAYEDASGGMQY